MALEIDAHGLHGRLSELLLEMTPTDRCEVHYLDRITGSFTLEQRAGRVEHVVMIGSGTGVAPFVSMVKQAHFVAASGRADRRQYTLFYGNRTRAELAYHEELVRIERAGAIDFIYLPSVSRPSGEKAEAGDVGRGRANNLLRLGFGLPTEEEETVSSDDPPAQQSAGSTRADVVAPILPGHVAADELSRRLRAPSTMVLVCGNPNATADIERVTGKLGIRCETEDW